MYNALGKTSGGRYLSVFFVLKFGKRALIITARDMTEREKKQYKKNKKMNNWDIGKASDYYDEHDIFESEDSKEASNLRFRLRRKKYVGVDFLLYSRIAELAKKIHTTTEELITTWLRQKLVHRA